MPKVTTLDAANKIFLYETTIAEELAMVQPEHHGMALDRMAALCGCFAMRATVQTIAAAAAVTVGELPISEPGYYIVFIENFVGVLTSKERLAVIHHEMAHIREGHLEGDAEGIVLETEYELAADRAAVKAVGAAHMASAIVTLINQSHDIKLELTTLAGRQDLHESIEESRRACLGHEMTLARLAALQ